ncbi:Histidine kinase-, DNA gyrase B-, and HSP90-like ATPase [Tenacibaculum sp. MAR_2009_124]|uniref:sensor histidine kinase n=1 Tax=Tenacibaculum sp. MAR_2009_124 TaxID=1250059 RepID=UPI0008975B69|nr:HAMP domain-containing sensor histidine kinase [Tenacibaculum sp. MAR_2009_124]SEB47955.1 Histidine kinase-, DNA gyrase B-, and HSP90-like ATPase [Tenacibaculum sp. MAR_2009_124]
MGKPLYVQIIIRITFLIINGVIIYHFFSTGYVINGIGFSLILLFQIFLFIDYMKKILGDIEKSIDCLLFEDYTNTISTHKRKNSLYHKTGLLLEKNRKKSLQNSSERLIFTNIIDSLPFGMLILRKNFHGFTEVFQLNHAFVNFLDIPKYYRWELLKEKIGPLLEFIEEWREVKHTLNISVNEKKETFFLKTSLTRTNEHEYLIVSLETIQQLIDKKEKESWYKLMNVMSHEIINTITPISSLAENLDSLIQLDNSEETFDELSQGLNIIKRRSQDLTTFVDNYRKLAELPIPKKIKLNLPELIREVLVLFNSEFEQKNITILFDNFEDVYVHGDKNQIEQVVINLISNAIYAVHNCKQPQIEVLLEQNEKRTFLFIKDNGIGVSEEIKDLIFVPYYTTRKEGAGIGLTLSKSIIEAHNGTIRFKSNEKITEFQVIFT